MSGRKRRYLGKGVCTLTLIVFLSSMNCIAQDKSKDSLILKVDETVSGPYGGQKSTACLRVYVDGRVLYSSWWNSAATIVNEKGEKTRPEHTASFEYKMDELDAWSLSEFLKFKAVRKLPEKFGPPHPPIDYIEEITVQIVRPKGEPQQIVTREFYVASMEEKTKYPSALIVLIDKIDEIEKEVEKKGKEVAVPVDCQSKPNVNRQE